MTESPWSSRCSRNARLRSAACSLTLGLALGLALTPPAEAAKRKREPALTPEDLTNFHLSPGLSQWLVGPMAKIASDEERRRFLALKADEEAEAFIVGFWQARVDPNRPWPQEQPEGVFERRALAADRLYTEGTRLGRRTDRGEIFILYGPPDSVRYWAGEGRRQQQITIEIWAYSKNAPPGLDLQPPQSQYYFTERDGLTVRYVPRSGQLQSVRR